MRRILIPEFSAPPPKSDGRPLALAGSTMGTQWSVRAIAPPDFDKVRLASAIEARLDALISQLSAWAPHSALSTFNDLPPGTSAAPPPDFAIVMEAAIEIARETNGAFDPSIGALVDLWGFGAQPAAQETPAREVLDQALERCGWRKLSFENGRLTQPGGLRLDVNGIAKGHSVDALCALLEQAGLVSYLVEIGGELRGAGVKPDGAPWWVEIEPPPGCGAPSVLAALYGVAIATSGEYRRSDVVGGERVAHTLDPKTGRPLRNGVASVSVLHASCMRADAYATALSVMGVEAGLAFADSIDLAAQIVARTPEGYCDHHSRAFARLLAN